MKIKSILEYNDPSDYQEDYNPRTDPKVLDAIEENFANVYSVFEDMEELSDEWIPALDKLDEILAAKKGCGESTQDYYINPNMVPKLKQAVQSGQIQQAFRWIIQNARTVEEIIESGEIDDVISDIGYDQQETRREQRNPYGYRGVSKNDFM